MRVRSPGGCPWSSPGRASESILDSYGTERGAHVQEIIEGAVALGKVICELDPLRAAERDAGCAPN